MIFPLDILILKITNLFLVFKELRRDLYSTLCIYIFNIAYPYGAIKLLNLFVIHKYDVIQKNELSKTKIKIFYNNLLSNSELAKFKDLQELKDIIELFGLESEYEIEQALQDLKERKKSKNILFRNETFENERKSNIFEILEWKGSSNSNATY